MAELEKSARTRTRIYYSAKEVGADAARRGAGAQPPGGLLLVFRLCLFVGGGETESGGSPLQSTDRLTGSSFYLFSVFFSLLSSGDGIKSQHDASSSTSHGITRVDLVRSVTFEMR